MTSINRGSFVNSSLRIPVNSPHLNEAQKTQAKSADIDRNGVVEGKKELHKLWKDSIDNVDHNDRYDSIRDPKALAQHQAFQRAGSAKPKAGLKQPKLSPEQMQHKLDELANKLGTLAGQQAALGRPGELDKIKQELASVKQNATTPPMSPAQKKAKLMDLAKRLGELAGRQAAIPNTKNRAMLEKIKQQLQTMYGPVNHAYA